MKNQYSYRRYLIATLLVATTFIFIARLAYLQLIDPSYRILAESNSRREVTQYPARGQIYDRNGKLIVSNQAAYDIMISPAQLSAFDTLEFCRLLGITPEYVNEGIKKAKEYSRYTSSIFLSQVSADVSAVFQEQLFKFSGFFVQTRTLRQYAIDIAPHILGYVGEADKKLLQDDPYYKMGDYVGISGIEKSYEKVLRGVKGRRYFLVDVHNRIINSYDEGRYDIPVEIGTDIVLSIDAYLQEYGEKLMKKFSGSIVAIEPSTGEILSLVSSPGYSPSLLVGRGLNENFNMLSGDTLLPLFNRAVAASYPPGSTFKIINGLVALQEKVIEPSVRFSCQTGFYFRNMRVGCHIHASPLDLREAIQNSCNAYFCNVFKRILENPKYNNTETAFNHWREHLLSFGFGQPLGADLFGELRGLVPQSSYYDKYYGKGRWNFLTVISLAIGQGELGITPIQLASMTAAISNHGYYFIPHLVKEIKNGEITEEFLEKHRTSVDSVYFDPIIDGMELAVNGGAGSTARIARIDNITVCGKTGTAENPFGDDHSVFIAFAPKENPLIAISVIIENVGFGASWAAPVASLMIEKYLQGDIKRIWLEEYILAGKQ